MPNSVTGKAIKHICFPSKIIANLVGLWVCRVSRSQILWTNQKVPLAWNTFKTFSCSFIKNIQLLIFLSSLQSISKLFKNKHIFYLFELFYTKISFHILKDQNNVWEWKIVYQPFYKNSVVISNKIEWTRKSKTGQRLSTSWYPWSSLTSLQPCRTKRIVKRALELLLLRRVRFTFVVNTTSLHVWDCDTAKQNLNYSLQNGLWLRALFWKPVGSSVVKEEL